MVLGSIDYDEYSTEELLEMSHAEATKGLNESQQRFCEYYIQNFNVKTAVRKAGYTSDYSSGQGYKLRSNRKCQRYIQWLKARTLKSSLVKGSDIIDQWVRIAFADISDFVDIKPTTIRLKKNEDIDGQLVKAIKTTSNGVSIELYDKMKALDSLAKYSSDMPKDYKQILEERKMELLEREFELKKKLYDIDGDETEDDGFIEALKKSTESVWDTSE